MGMPHWTVSIKNKVRKVASLQDLTFENNLSVHEKLWWISHKAESR